MVRRFGPLFHQLVLLHLHHAQERLETQGLAPFVQYLDRLADKEKPSRGDLAVLKLPEVVIARREAEEYLRTSRESSHPKLDALVELVRETLARPREHPPRILVFAQYRDTIQTIQSILELQGWTTGRFVGQATRDAEDKGMNQKDQGRILTAFREGRFPVLVASSVAEEGLDVPDVDLVVFFESVPSEIRAIQRRGRSRSKFPGPGHGSPHARDSGRPVSGRRGPPGTVGCVASFVGSRRKRESGRQSPPPTPHRAGRRARTPAYKPSAAPCDVTARSSRLNTEVRV